MIGYILSSIDLSVKDLLEYEDYEFNTDIDYSSKSSITVAKKPNIDIDDFVICKDSDNNVVFIGICENYESASDTSVYTIKLKQKECLFDRFIFVGSEGLIASNGIEDFIVKAINSYWVNTGDSLVNKSYITATAKTHTPKSIKIMSASYCENGVYNLKTCLGNMLEYYGIRLDFKFSNGALSIEVYNDDSASIAINTNISDISDYEETYSVDILAKLWVKWVVPSTGAYSFKNYYLLNDRTISTDINNVNRVRGEYRVAYIEAETEAEMYQQALNEFASNTYNHKITFDLLKESKLYDYEDFYVGRPATIITKSGKQNSIITAVQNDANNGFVAITFGKLKVTLIDKLRS